MTYWGAKCRRCSHPRLNHIQGTRACEAGACRCDQFTQMSDHQAGKPATP